MTEHRSVCKGFAKRLQNVESFGFVEPRWPPEKASHFSERTSSVRLFPSVVVHTCTYYVQEMKSKEKFEREVNKLRRTRREQ